MGRGSRTAVFAAACALGLSAAAPSRAATYYVRRGGDDRNDGRSAARAFRNVLAAAQVLDHGDNVVIGPGVYRGTALFADRFSADDARMSVTGDKNGRLTGDAPGPVVLEPPNAVDPALSFFRFRGLTVSGITVRGAGQGVKLEKCADVSVERCTFDGAARGLVAEGVEGLRVESCVFARCTIGVFISGTVRSRLAHLTVAASGSAGVVVLLSGEGAIRNCVFAANNTSYVADAVSASAWTSNHNAIRGPTGPWGDAPSVYNIHEWHALTGQERHSIHVLPTFGDPGAPDLRVSREVGWGGGLPGMDVGIELSPPVRLDRDGAPFRVRGGAVSVGAYDYPDPVPAGGWTRLAATLAEGGPRMSAGVYRAGGELVRTLIADAAGVRELWWDGLDDTGRPAPGGAYEVRSISHDARLVDEGTIGDNGNPKGVWNCDQADCVAVFPDGSFAITAVYDEAGFAFRRYAASGQSVFASAFVEGGFWAISASGEDVIGGLGADAGAKIVRLAPPGERAPMRSGAEAYPILAPGEKGAPSGLALAGGDAFVAIPALGMVRVIDMATGERVRDLPLPGVADVACDAEGRLWAIAGTDVVSLGERGPVGRRAPTGLSEPRYLAAGAGRLAAVDRKAARIAVLDAASGRVVQTLGRARPAGEFTPVAPDLFRDPRRAAFLPDGRLIVTEHARVRALWPEGPGTSFELLSNFMDSAVVHPASPEHVYCALGVFRVDPKTGAWEWLVEEPQGKGPPGADGKPTSLGVGSPHGAVMLGGRPFIFYYRPSVPGGLLMLDVTDPLRPRRALDFGNEPKVFGQWAYSTISFSKGGDIVCGPANYKLLFRRIGFKGLDAERNPVFDFANPEDFGFEKDPSPRGMQQIEAISCDRSTGDVYYLAVTDLHRKMVPGWGADGTGVGRSTPDGAPLWFSLSTGGNYMSVSAVNDGAETWVMAAKSFGGQIDVYERDGLHVTTGNWGWRCGYAFGFVDLRFGVHGYLRPDGKVGAYVEDDAIGRFGRARLDGCGTLRRAVARVTWQGGGERKEAPLPDIAEGPRLERKLTIPKVPELALDGDWSAWERAGVPTQIVSLPASVGFKRTVPGDLMRTFRAGTLIGGFAHDGRSFYVAFLVADDTQHFDAPGPATLWQYDGIELWLEEEQVGLGFLRDGPAAVYKWRQHNREGKDWAANYELPRATVWGAKLPDLSAHPLGRRLASVTGVPFGSKPGYVLMARIPFEEVKLVGGIAGRKGGEILPMTGAAGEVVRIAVALNGVSAFGRSQDYQIDWPVGRMFADPTRSCPFELGE